MNCTGRVMIVAGEASGDLYGARLAAEMRRREPAIRFFGMGGDRMRGEGVETLINADDMAVMGLVEVAAHARVIFHAYSRLKSILFSEPPDLLVLIDYQEFNQILARAAKRAGVRVLFFISPQFWAWRPGRVKKMARIVDHMAVLFPFEVSAVRAGRGAGHLCGASAPRHRPPLDGAQGGPTILRARPFPQ